MATHPNPVPVDTAAGPLPDYHPVTLYRQRRDGWTAERQRTFLTALAASGCVSDACARAGVSRRSAYSLRRRPDARAFAYAWDRALRLAAGRWAAITFVSPRPQRQTREAHAHSVTLV